jgi:hypothetical protein
LSEFARVNFGETKKWEREPLKVALTELLGGESKVTAAIKVVCKQNFFGRGIFLIHIYGNSCLFIYLFFKINKLLRSKRGDLRKSAKERIEKYYVPGDVLEEDTPEGRKNLEDDVLSICQKLIKTRRITANDKEFVKRMILIHFKKIPAVEECESDSE